TPVRGLLLSAVACARHSPMRLAVPNEFPCGTTPTRRLRAVERGGDTSGSTPTSPPPSRRVGRSQRGGPPEGLREVHRGAGQAAWWVVRRPLSGAVRRGGRLTIGRASVRPASCLRVHRAAVSAPPAWWVVSSAPRGSWCSR